MQPPEEAIDALVGEWVRKADLDFHTASVATMRSKGRTKKAFGIAISNSANVLVTESGAKLLDFGLAKNRTFWS